MRIKRISDAVVRKFKMRLCHISDTHGSFPQLYGSYDVIVHSGDFFPDPPGNPLFKEEVGKWQLEWLEDNIHHMLQWVNGRDFLFTLGNHDWADPFEMTKLLGEYGIKSCCLHDRVVDYGGVHFYGFPYVPAINGQFNFERELPEMQQEVNWMVDKINNADYVDVLVCHAPPHQTLDLSTDNKILGSTCIANALDYLIKEDKLPSYYLCGHIHNANGITMRNAVVVSNAARSKHIIEIR